MNFLNRVGATRNELFDGEVGTLVDDDGALWFVSRDLNQAAQERFGMFTCYDLAVGLSGWAKGQTQSVHEMAMWVAYRVLPRFGAPIIQPSPPRCAGARE